MISCPVIVDSAKYRTLVTRGWVDTGFRRYHCGGALVATYLKAPKSFFESGADPFLEASSIRLPDVEKMTAAKKVERRLGAAGFYGHTYISELRLLDFARSLPVKITELSLLFCGWFQRAAKAFAGTAKQKSR